MKVILTEDVKGTGKKADAVGDAVADEKIGNGRNREIGKDLDQGVDLVFLTDRAEFQKGKPGVHGQHHDSAQQHEQYITA